MKIRPATPTDIPAWGQLRHKLWQSHASNELITELTAFFDGTGGRPEVCFVLECEEGDSLPAGTLGGFIEASIRPYAEGCKSQKVGYLEGWFVDEALRWQGWGGKMVKQAEAWAREQGCTEMASDYVPENTVSARAHHAMGYQVITQVVCLRKPL
jgi:aminoglycoside 6'-N-acetyltransferase I